MKHLFTFLLLAISASCFAQGNLQFNQVLSFNYSTSLGNYTSSNVDTLNVPEGKVWKITSASSVRVNGSSLLPPTSCAIKVDNHVLSKNSTSGAISVQTPYWLKSGPHTITLSSISSTVQIYTFHGSISIIEFNVLP